MAYTISNEYLSASFRTLGAELTSLQAQPSGTNFLWSGDPAFWGKHSPILFPIVGGLKENQYFYNGNAYTLPRHGFAREREFTCTEQTETSIRFQLQDDEQTRDLYPFAFQLEVRYRLEGNRLRVQYTVTNPAQEAMLFSLGAHPAFAVPIDPSLTYSDYFLEFDTPVTAARWPLNEAGLIQPEPHPFWDGTKRVPLSHELFYTDALVFKQFPDNAIRIRSDKHPAYLEFQWRDFPYFGIWAAKNAPFVCLEPWCGIADSVDSSQQLHAKEGMHALEGGKYWQREWSVSVVG